MTDEIASAARREALAVLYADAVIAHAIGAGPEEWLRIAGDVLEAEGRARSDALAALPASQRRVAPAAFELVEAAARRGGVDVRAERDRALATLPPCCRVD